MEKRFKALRTIGTIFKVIGIILGALTVLGALAVCVFATAGSSLLSGLSEYGTYSNVGFLGGAVGGILSGLLALLYGGIMAIGTYASGEALFLALAVEENTRASAEASRATSALLQILSTPKPAAPAAPEAPATPPAPQS